MGFWEIDGELKPGTRQGLHLVGLLALFLPILIVARHLPGADGWLPFAPITAMLHQGLVALAWRSEIFGQHVSRRLGSRWLVIFGALFLLLISARIAGTVGTSLASPGDFVATPLVHVMTGAIILAATWTGIDVLRYLGLHRALGADHFSPEVREMGLVRRGIFRYVPNPMYTLSNLVFLLPGLLLRSYPGILIGCYHYVAVWLHYWATEKPDMEFLYGRGK